MLALPLFLAAASVPPVGGDLGQMRAAIWYDMERDAMIGNGNEAVTLSWFYGEDEEFPPTLTIVELTCRERGKGRRCTFSVTRMPNPGASVADKAEASRIDCKADFMRPETGKDEWDVVHTPPRRGGHSKTSMECKVR